VGAMRAKDEFKLQENGIYIATGQKECVVEKIMIVLQTDFRELSRIPGQVPADS
jgi:hypothetical protein